MDAFVLPNVDVSNVDKLLRNDQGLIHPVPHSSLENIPIEHILLWCVQNGVYVVPTTELISFLKNEIAGKAAIEICAGHGSIGRSLGIPTTDSYVQTDPQIQACYRLLGQKPIDPPPDVLKYEANVAVDLYQPQIVIGAFVTEIWTPGNAQGSVYGVDEVTLNKKIDSYIHIGNDHTHGWKTLMKKEHKVFRFPWLVTRTRSQSLNHIRIWERNQCPR